MSPKLVIFYLSMLFDFPSALLDKICMHIYKKGNFKKKKKMERPSN